MVLDVPKGLGARAHQREKLWALKNEVLDFWNLACIRRFGDVHACMLLAHVCILETLILTTLMAQLQMAITHSILIQIRQNMCSN